MFLLNENRKMHIVLITYLIITLIADIYVVKNDIYNLFNELNSKSITLFTVTILDTFFTIMLLRWKKFAFYGLGITTLVTFIYNLTEGYGIIVSLVGLFGFLIICGLMFLKKDGKTGYQNLE